MAVGYLPLNYWVLAWLLWNGRLHGVVKCCIVAEFRIYKRLKLHCSLLVELMADQSTTNGP
jgi:hypothetical protein